MDCTEENTIQFYESAFFVQLVLCLGTSGDFDQGADYFWGVFARFYEMPRVLC